MEQFLLEKYLENPSRKVVTRDGRLVRILDYNLKGDKHICIAVNNKTQESITTVDEDGHCLRDKTSWHESNFDLFFADEEEELTEFDYAVLSIISDHNSHKDSIGAFAKRSSKKLLDLARKELEANYYTKVIDDRMVFKSELHEQSLQTAYDMGKQDALKDLPKWKKITEKEQNYLAYGYLSHDGYYLSIQELKDKLPKEE